MASLTPTIPRGFESGGDFTDYAGRLRRARLALVVLVTPIFMLFVSFTSAYIFRQGLPTLDERSGQYVSDWITIALPLRLLLVNSFLLLISTVTMELARRQMARRTVLTGVQGIPGVSVSEKHWPWLPITVALGLAFLAGQSMAWRQLAARGIYVGTAPSSSFAYLLTASHAIHLLGGIVALLAALVLSVRGRQPERQYIIVDSASWYWHFMAFLWIYIFGLLYFAR